MHRSGGYETLTSKPSSMATQIIKQWEPKHGNKCTWSTVCRFSLTVRIRWGDQTLMWCTKYLKSTHSTPFQFFVSYCLLATWLFLTDHWRPTYLPESKDVLCWHWSEPYQNTSLARVKNEVKTTLWCQRIQFHHCVNSPILLNGPRNHCFNWWEWKGLYKQM